MDQAQTIWAYNGHEYKLDLQEVATAERFEAAFQALAQMEKQLPKDGGQAAALRAYCALYMELFNALLGIDAQKELFNGSLNAGLCEDAYESLLAFAYAQKEAVNIRRKNLLAKYSPDRAQRRAQG